MTPTKEMQARMATAVLPPYRSQLGPRAKASISFPLKVVEFCTGVRNVVLGFVLAEPPLEGSHALDTAKRKRHSKRQITQPLAYGERSV